MCNMRAKLNIWTFSTVFTLLNKCLILVYRSISFSVLLMLLWYDIFCLCTYLFHILIWDTRCANLIKSNPV